MLIVYKTKYLSEQSITVSKVKDDGEVLKIIEKDLIKHKGSWEHRIEELESFQVLN